MDERGLSIQERLHRMAENWRQEDRELFQWTLSELERRQKITGREAAIYAAVALAGLAAICKLLN